MASPLTIHPLLVISITDHYTRVVSSPSSVQHLPICGLLFGTAGDVLNSLEVAVARGGVGAWTFDEESLVCWIERVGA